MSTNPIPEGSSNITVNMPDRLKADASKLAKKSDMKLGTYIRTVLEVAVSEGDVFETPKPKKVKKTR